MAIERDKHGEFYVECSLCEDIEELPDAQNFNDAVQEAKGAGWLIRQEGSGWMHVCPTCKEDMP